MLRDMDRQSQQLRNGDIQIRDFSTTKLSSLEVHPNMKRDFSKLRRDTMPAEVLIKFKWRSI